MTCDPEIGPFVSHEWAAVLATRRQDARRAIETLAALSTPYRQPLYSYLRLRGHSPEDAKDLTGQFFDRLLQSKTLAYMKRDCAKLRSFLLTALNRFLTEQASPAAARAVDCGDSIEKLFEHNWASAVLAVVYDRLQAEYSQAGQMEAFAHLKFCLAGNTDALPWAELAASLGVEESAVKTSVQALRRRHKEMLREEITRLVATPADAEEELRSLFPTVAAA